MRTTRIPTTAQIRELEADWIKQCGASWSQVLMEIAGRGAAQQFLKVWQSEPGLVTVVCGRGNNGGDGMVVARYLYLWSVPVKVLLISKEETPEKQMQTAESRTNRDILDNLGVSIEVTTESIEDELADSSCIIDALFGTGLDRDIEGAYRIAIEAINRSGNTVFAIDIPSGVNSDSGKIMGVAVRADHTSTFGYLKPGLLCHPGASLVGELGLVDIGLPPPKDGKPYIQLSTSDYVRGLLPPRPTDSNKGTFGTVLTIAGSLGMSGATLLSTHSALRTGAGLVLLATPKSLVANLPPGEVIYVAIEETEDQSISLKALPAIEAKLEKVTAAILGPGMSTQEETVQFVHQFLTEVLPESDKPCLIDADALNAIAKTGVFPKECGDRIVLTPHPKELSRLMDCKVDEIQSDRVASAISAAEAFNCVIVLKGSNTVIASPDGDVFINPTGNAGMATAGAGDVLSGIIGALLAQGLHTLDAAVAGVYIHGLAGDIAARELGETGVIAGDIRDAVPYAIQSLEQGGVSEIERQIFADEYASASEEV